MTAPPATTRQDALMERCRAILAEEEHLRQGGGEAGCQRQINLGRLPVRERLAHLLDQPAQFLEIGLWNGYEMYESWGAVPAAGVIAGIGKVSGKPCMVIANDATVKAGAMFPQSIKKVLRAQRIAFECALPIIYLVDSSGVFLPLQEEIFPDEDDFGRIFRNNSVLSAGGIPQYAAIMGNCVAGGAYLPVLCDKILMTEGSGLYLAAPSLVKAAIGQEIDAEELGGAAMHEQISGTIDFREPDDPTCLDRLQALLDMLADDRAGPEPEGNKNYQPERDPNNLYDLISLDGRKEYDARDMLACIIDEGSLQEYKKEYGKSLVTAYGKIGGRAIGIVANQRKRTRSKKTGFQMGGVIYADSADKAARFVMDCNQCGLPIVFFQDVTGFMVGRAAEESGIIRSGAKMVNAVSNSTVPKITVVVGGSFGAGNYALCGKAYDPRFIFAWPNAKFAVMGAEQAADTLFSILLRAQRRKGGEKDAKDLELLRNKVRAQYQVQTDIRYGAARGWVDAIIQPHDTRNILIETTKLVSRQTPSARFHSGVLQV